MEIYLSNTSVVVLGAVLAVKVICVCVFKVRQAKQNSEK